MKTVKSHTHKDQEFTDIVTDEERKIQDLEATITALEMQAEKDAVRIRELSKILGLGHHENEPKEHHFEPINQVKYPYIVNRLRVKGGWLYMFNMTSNTGLTAEFVPDVKGG